MNINLNKQEVNNLLIFLTDKGRVRLTGDEAFEFVNIVNKIANAKEDTSIIEQEVIEPQLEE